MTHRLALGIDVGTSGVRAAALKEDFTVISVTKASMDLSRGPRNDPSVWLGALSEALSGIVQAVDTSGIEAICVDGTSGTVLALDAAAEPVGHALMYNDAVDDPAIAEAIASVAPRQSAAHGASSALARSIRLQTRSGVARIAHQADWIAEQLAGKPVPSDESNALKTGYDPVARHWPDWMSQTGMDTRLLPDVVATGTMTGVTSGAFGLPKGIPIVAGVSDGCASFLATGASTPGDGVTALGTTVTLKLLSDKPIFAPEYGIYSHRIGDQWLAGGASNSGGEALAAHFAPDEIVALSKLIDPEISTGLDYYPLPRVGERFPVNDPDLQSRVDPRPETREEFLKGLLEGIAAIERLGFERLADLGGPKLTSIRTVGGGAGNPTWTRMRTRLLKTSEAPVASGEAAAGSARIAWGFLKDRA
ncbi:MAG: FGGY-family carbohydrate kinase [Roseibium sp.]|uniref:FGGY-family carbohydrate kinase n=1 Tax=Roseibium sp. TaxID=1936156 RepID=UPI003D9C4D81